MTGGIGTTTYGYEVLSSITSAAGTFGYSYLGNTAILSQLNLPNGTYTSFSYDALERLTGVGNRKADTSLLSGYTYGYDNRDVRTWMERQVGAGTVQHVNYSYDTVDQLTQEASTEAQPQLNTTYAYDPMGNRSSAQASGTYTGVYSNSNTVNKLNQFTSYASTSGGTTTTRNLLYDPSGNLTRQTLSGGSANGGSTYSYDEADRLTQVVRANETTGVNEGKSEFVYDAFSRKVINREYVWSNGAWLQTSETRRIYDGMDVVQERDGSNAVTVNYTRDGNIGGLLARSTSAGHFYYHYDGSGNVTQLTDSTQATVAEYTYDAYGVLITSSGAQSGQPYRFSTKEYHSPTGLYDYGFRFYSPSMGRWINRDPIEEEGGLNLYRFVANNPVKWVDLYGLTTWSGGWQWQGGAFGVGGAAGFQLGVGHDDYQPWYKGWSSGLITSYGGGAYIGSPSFGGASTTTITSAASIDDLAGAGTETGGGVTLPTPYGNLGGGVSIITGGNNAPAGPVGLPSTHQNYGGVETSAGFSLGAPGGSLYGFKTQTQTVTNNGVNGGSGVIPWSRSC